MQGKKVEKLLRESDRVENEPLSRESPLPLIQYKRKLRQLLHSFGSQTTQDTVSSVAATLEENEAEPVATMVPTSSSTDELINHLEKEKQKMAVERETYQLDLMSAQVMVSVLQGQIDALRAENEELKKTKG